MKKNKTDNKGINPAAFCLFVQAVHIEMEEALHEKDELKLRVHSYISEVSRIEKLMAMKARENCVLLQLFKL